jgi:hypothetical protein
MPQIISRDTVSDQQIIQSVQNAVKITSNLRAAKNVEDIIRIVRQLQTARAELSAQYNRIGGNTVVKF